MTVFHKGERLVQQKLSVEDAVAPFGQKAIRSFMPDQHRAFFEKLPMIIIGAVDQQGRPWSTVAFGEPGFATSPCDTRLEIQAMPLLTGCLNLELSAGAKLGLLGIELETRRRNRMNGTVAALTDRLLSVDVDQSFGNCPQYIQRRQLKGRNETGNNFDQSPKPILSDYLSDDARYLIQSNDTFFIASRSSAFSDDPRAGVDVSHPGGRPGFVRIDGTKKLIFPDFSGNKFFNTLGNITGDNRVGLFFPDFENGNAVFLSDRAEILWDNQFNHEFPGAERFVSVEIDLSAFCPRLLPIFGEYIDQWPPLDATGVW